jgi:tetratricopeptide (TPR) repeat protein
VSSSVIVTCPKCRKQQPVDAAIPPEGLRYACAYCQTAFRIKLPPGTPPPRAPARPAPPLPDFNEIALGDPRGGPESGSFFDGELPAPVPSSRSFDFSSGDLPAAREDIPMPGDLPAPRDSIPLPDDYLASRDSIPRPDDLPAPRDSIPLPDDYLASRDSIPRPGDLPAPRHSIPLPDDFLAPRESVPRPDDLLAPRDSMPLPDDLLSPLEGPSGMANLPMSHGGQNLPMSHAGQNLPRAVQGPGGQANLPVSALGQNLPTPVKGPAGQANLPVSLTGQNLPTPVKGPAGQANLPVSLKGANLPVSRLAQLGLATQARTRAKATGAPPAVDLDPFAGDIPSAQGSPLEELELTGSGGHARATLTPMKGLDAAFGLELEGGSAPQEDSSGQPRRPLNISVPSAAAAAPVADDGLLRPLIPHAVKKGAASQDELLEYQPSRRRPMVIVGAVATAVALSGAAFLFLRARNAEPRPEEALGPIAAEISSDSYPAYQRGADRLLEVAGLHPESISLRAAAAEDLLVAFLAHGGERSKLAQAEQIVTALPAQDRPNAYAARARALLSLAKGKPGEVAGQLGLEASTPEGDLVVGLRELAAVKRDPAAAAFRRFIAGRPDRVLGVYLLARSVEESNPTEAGKSYRAVLARTPSHFGAQLGLARLADGPAAQLAAAQKLLERKGGSVPRSEIAEANVAAGRAAQALGRSSDAAASYAKALAADPQNPIVNVALGEGYMFEGRYTEALQRFQAAGPVGLRTSAGKFGLGGALIATGKLAPGLAQIHQAATESPKDPRGLFYGGLAAELGSPPDLEAAGQSYRAALALDKKFLPASLHLAALMERQSKPEEALAVLREAEAAGAPPTALQIAWGQALIVGKEPVRAEEVFRKAVEATPKEVPAHLGLASALEAQNKGEAAREVLDKALVEIPEAVQAREHLAALTAKLGHKDDAVTEYKKAIASGHSPLTTRVAMAKLQLDLGQLDDAQAELDKVIDENPSTPEALFTLGRVWEARGDLVHSVQELRRALRFENLPEVQLELGRVLLKLGKEPEAMAALDAAATLPDALVDRGRVFYRKGDYEKALADYDAAIKQAPQDPRAWTGKGLSHDRLGEAVKASEAWKTALRLAPDDPETHYRIGRFELDKGNMKSAIEHLRIASGKVPEKADWDAEVFFQLGTAEVTGGSKAAALAAFKKYLEIAPADAASRPEAKRQVQRLGGGK